MIGTITMTERDSESPPPRSAMADQLDPNEVWSRISFVGDKLQGIVGIQDNSSDYSASTFIAASVLIVVMFLFQSHKRRNLKRELEAARAELSYMQDRLAKLDQQKPVRIFMDGAFDMLHFGHMNAFRLARSLGTHLIVGVNSDVSITECKGAPLMNDEERLTMVSSCKFVDEVVPNCPYVMSTEYLESLMKRHNIDYVAHGSDPCYDLNGQEVYASARKLGIFRTIPRTEGVSTTELVGRMLLSTKQHHCTEKDQMSRSLGSKSKFLTTSRMIQLFSADVKAPLPGMRVIYVDGTWDLFHAGHVAFLQAARERGDYLLVGIHGDSLVNRVRGGNLPLMNLHERVLSVLGCKYVSDVVIDAPYEISPDMIRSLSIAEVVRGLHNSQREVPDEDKRYQHAINAKMYTVIDCPANFDIGNVLTRIQKNQVAFQSRFERKRQVEDEFFSSLSVAKK